ncbi:MAG: tRNA (adenosine(37)-N6)-threonylcarbamoyltransferase complex dimerization subunit type 1 TsaB [Acidobacteriales bacterium 13_2_20CM_2_55_5]|nr:MAG: tRNA (adenosine(37)-N6)-threonylcarbamoyltransferase complex dimerization subunit type 1 TsaB [Acidobacteriales bacterium 13_2_20CM_2_55_5]
MNNGTCDVIEVVPLAGGTFSAQLVPQIAALLSKHGFKKQDIDAFAVASGPGSFTGLRVGLAAIKGLAEILAKPIATVSLLEVVAIAGGTKGRVLAVLEAGRGEVYAGQYEVSDERATMIDERLIKLDSLAATDGGSALVTPEKSIAETLVAKGVRAVEVPAQQSDAVAHQGWKKILAGETVSPEALEANYIRRSDAEIFSKGRS